MTAVTACRTCGTEPLSDARFCHGCGSAVAASDTPAEYKQVTVLFADVVHSMSIAAAVGAERLREIMAELVNRAMGVVQRYGATVDQFTGDGIMAVFGAPVALEDHALRACLAALEIQREVEGLAVDIERRDGVSLQLRIGLNSGQVIAGEFGSAAIGYTAVGEQVGMAQRMESVAPPGGVMLSESTAQLVGRAAILGEPEKVAIKGADAPVAARRLLGVESDRERILPTQSTLVGRELELHTLTGLLDRAMGGRGSVVGVVGPPGIGKSRLVREVAEIAKSRGVYVNSHYCESHAAQIPFRAIAGLFRAAWIEGVGDAAVRALVRARIPDADPDDMLLLDDLLGIGDPEVALPRIDPDARRRRLTAMINTATLNRTEPVVYVMEDVHWIDEVSESLLADVLAVTAQTSTMVVITYRPEYQGALTRVHGAQTTIALTPLTDTESSSLIGELLGPDPSVGELAATVVSRVGGNPFFAEETVRELAQRGVLDGERGGYVCQADGGDVSVPATVQATIGARIDRLDTAAKRTLNAASVIGLRFSPELLASLGVEPALDELVQAELIDQVRFTPEAEYAFHHPLIRAVAYESQLKSDRGEWHRRLAAEIEAGDPDSIDENAALIAEHLEAAGDLRKAYGWHMRAGRWSTRRDIAAARTSWERARLIADALPDSDPDRTTMRIAPRTKLCGSAWRGVNSNPDRLVEELRELCPIVGDNASLAIGLTALALHRGNRGGYRESVGLAAEVMALLETVGEPTSTIGAATALASVRHEAGQSADVLRWSQSVIDRADAVGWDDRTHGSPLIALALIFRGIARWWLGRDGWRQDLDDAVALAPRTDPITHPSVVAWKYLAAIPHGILLPDDAAVRELEAALKVAEASGEDTSVGNLKNTLGRILVARESAAERQRGLILLDEVRELCVQREFFLINLPVLDVYAARERASGGGFDEALPLIRQAVAEFGREGQVVQGIWSTTVLVETLLKRGTECDLMEAEDVVDSLAKLPDDISGVMRDV
ncbi:MAG TPA: AAA family ATPase, partial [Mycobacterium sp.]|nr:AAA family ATPase [Mycobacterium sp.]